MAIGVQNVVPEAGEINRDTPIQFEVCTSDSDPFVRVIVGVHFPGSGVVEIAYAQNPSMGGPYETFYATNSTVEEIAGSSGFTTFRFSILRQADGHPVWPDSPFLRIYGFNTAGEEIGSDPKDIGPQ